MEQAIANLIKYSRTPTVYTGRVRVKSPVLDYLTVNGDTRTVWRIDTEAEFIETYGGKQHRAWYAVDMRYEYV